MRHTSRQFPARSANERHGGKVEITAPKDVCAATAGRVDKKTTRGGRGKQAKGKWALFDPHIEYLLGLFNKPASGKTKKKKKNRVKRQVSAENQKKRKRNRRRKTNEQLSCNAAG